MWGGIVGQRWWHWLRAEDFRTEQGARAILIRLIHKVGVRLRRINYWAGRMEVCVSFSFREEGWSGSIALGLCQDTQTMIESFNALWRYQVILYDLVSDCSAGAPLFPAEQRRLDLARTLDRLNSKFGPDTIYFGGMHGMASTAPTRVAFNQIPDQGTT